MPLELKLSLSLPPSLPPSLSLSLPLSLSLGRSLSLALSRSHDRFRGRALSLCQGAPLVCVSAAHPGFRLFRVILSPYSCGARKLTLVNLILDAVNVRPDALTPALASHIPLHLRVSEVDLPPSIQVRYDGPSRV